jgi:ABC-type Fe3+-hydroxamate transport system substrate-binding protein
MMIKRRWRIGLALLALVSIGGPVRAQDGGDFPREVIDATGATVIVPERPAVVAVAGAVPELAAFFPAERVRTVDLAGEGIAWQDIGLLVMPDLIAAAYPAVIAAARAADVPVFQTGAIASLADWRGAVERLGRATGEDERARAALDRLAARLAWVGAAAAGERGVRVLALTPEGYTFGRGAFLTELITAAGGVNVAAEAGYDDFRQVDDAALRDLRPDVILLSPAWDAAQIAALRAHPAAPDAVIRLPFSPTQPRDPGGAVVILGWMLHPRALGRAVMGWE